MKDKVITMPAALVLLGSLLALGFCAWKWPQAGVVALIGAATTIVSLFTQAKPSTGSTIPPPPAIPTSSTPPPPKGPLDP